MSSTIPPIERQFISESTNSTTNGLQESFNWITVGCGAYLLLSLITYTPQDSGWSYVGPRDIFVQNAGGTLGAWCADLLIYLFGYIAFLIPGVMIWRGLIAVYYNDVFIPKRILLFAIHWVGFIFTLIFGTILLELYAYNSTLLPFPAGSGGVLGQFLTPLSLKTLQPLGSVLLSIAGFAIGITALSGLSWIQVIELIGAFICTLIYWIFWPILILIPKKNKTVPTIEPADENSLTQSNSLTESNLPIESNLSTTPITNEPELSAATDENIITTDLNVNTNTNSNSENTNIVP